MLGLENVDCPIAESISKGLDFVRAAQDALVPALPRRRQPDRDGVRRPVPAARGGGQHLVAIHMKDGRLREIRRVPFGDGIVDFAGVFRTLHEVGYRGPLVVEMWNEGEQDPIAAAARALSWLRAARNAATPRQQTGETP